MQIEHVLLSIVVLLLGRLGHMADQARRETNERLDKMQGHFNAKIDYLGEQVSDLSSQLAAEKAVRTLHRETRSAV